MSEPLQTQPDSPKPEPHSTFPGAVQPAKAKAKKLSRGERLTSMAEEVLADVNNARDRYNDLVAAWESASDDLQGAIDEIETHLEQLRDIRQEYEDWLENLPESLRDSPVGEKLQTLVDIDLDPDLPEVPDQPDEPNFDDVEASAQEILDADPPLGFGRD